MQHRSTIGRDSGRAVAPGDSDPSLSTSDIAGRLAMSRRTVERLCRSGRLSAIRIGGRWRVSPDELAAFVSRLRSEARPPGEMAG